MHKRVSSFAATSGKPLVPSNAITDYVDKTIDVGENMHKSGNLGSLIGGSTFKT